jgi:TrmH family RNA methyltransferase
MTAIKTISSTQNPLIKQLVALQEKGRQRKKTGTFVLEGQKELRLAVAGGYIIDSLLFAPHLINPSELEALCGQIQHQVQMISLSPEVYAKLAYRGSTEGIMAVAHAKNHDLTDLQLGDQPLVLVAEAPEKPGNIGALLRTAEAAGVDAVIIANPRGDLYNPNIIRSSVGAVFTSQIAIAPSAEVIDFLKQNHIRIYGAALTASVPYTQIDFTAATAIVVGTEATGLSPIWLEHSDQNIIIPMQGQIDSMNVSVSAAILIFEACRQRLGPA